MTDLSTELKISPLENKRKRFFYPVLILSLSASFLFYKYILQVSPSVMTQELMQFFHATGSELGNLGAYFFYSYIIAQLFVGPLLDKYSSRYLTASAILLSAVGIFLFADSHSLKMAEFARILMGLGAAFASISYLKMTTLWFRPNQFAVLSGFLATACMMGAILGQTLLALLTDRIGWKQSLYYCATAGTVFALLFFLIVRDKNPPEEGLIHSSKPTFKDFREVIKNKRNWLLMIYTGFAFAPVAVFGGLWGNPFLQEAYDLTRSQAASLISLIFLGTAVGAPLWGWLSEYLKNRLGIMGAGTALSLIATVGVIYTHSALYFLSVLLFLFGLGTGSFMVAYAYGREINHTALVATAIALINTGDGALGGVTQALVGKALDIFWKGGVTSGIAHFTLAEYHRAFSLLPLYQFMALIVIKTIARYHARVGTYIKASKEISEL